MQIDSHISYYLFINFSLILCGTVKLPTPQTTNFNSVFFFEFFLKSHIISTEADTGNSGGLHGVGVCQCVVVSCGLVFLTWWRCMIVIVV